MRFDLYLKNGDELIFCIYLTGFRYFDLILPILYGINDFCSHFIGFKNYNQTPIILCNIKHFFPHS